MTTETYIVVQFLRTLATTIAITIIAYGVKYEQDMQLWQLLLAFCIAGILIRISLSKPSHTP